MDKRARSTSFDAAVILFVIAVIIILTCHLTSIGGENAEALKTLVIGVSPDKKTQSRLQKISEGDALISEDRFVYVYKGYLDGVLYLEAEGRLTSGGYMHKDGRMLCTNQPIGLSSDNGILWGRIKFIKEK